MPNVEVQLFQIPGVKLDGVDVAFPFKRVDALFYYLVCRKSATRQELVNLLWEDCAEETGYKNLRHTIYTLRKCLGSDIVLTNPKTEVRLNPAREIVCDYDPAAPLESRDIDQFLRGFTVKNAPNYNAWVDQTREQLNARTLGQLELQAAAALERGDLAGAERLALEYLNQDGLDEKMVTFLMRLYRQEGRYYKAANLYQRLKEKLADELGISPLHETTALYYEIVNQWNQTTDEAAPAAEGRLSPGRQALVNQLRSCCQRFLDGYSETAAVLLHGPAGCGKTYLLQRFLHAGDLKGTLLLTASCAMDAAGELEPWKAVMLTLKETVLDRRLTIPEGTRRALAQVFPVFADGGEADRAPQPDGQGRYGDALAAAAALLISLAAQKRKVVLVIENLHWMDAASQDLLYRVLRRMGGSQLLMAATSRTPGLKLAGAFGDSLVRVGVPCFTDEETGAFLQEALGQEVSPAVLARVCEATGGNPRMLSDLAASLEGKPLTEEALPDQASILRQRLSGLSRDAQDLVQVLSLFREKAPCSLLSEITGFGAAQLYDLSVELREHGLIEELCRDGESYLAFLHPHLRETVYQSLSYFKRQPLHQRIADYLEQHLREDQGGDYLHLVYHCRQCGDGLRAFRYQVLYLSLYTQNCCEIPPRQNFTAPAPLPEDIGDDFRELEQDLRRLRRQGEARGLDALERQLLCAKARYFIYTGRYQEGIAITNQLLELFAHSPASDPDFLLEIQRQQVAYGLQIDQQAACGDQAARGLEIAEQADLPAQRAYFLLFRGICFCKGGDFYKSEYFLREAAAQSVSLPGARWMFSAVVHGWLGECRRRQEDFAAACAEYRTAVELMARPGHLPGAGWIYTCYGRAVLALGDDGRAAELFNTALAAYDATQELPGRALAQSYAAWYAAKDRQYDEAAALLAASWESASQQSSLVEQGIRDSVLAMLRRELDQSGATDNALHRYLYRPLDIYCHRGLQRLRGVAGLYECRWLEDCLKFSVRQAKPLSVESLYSKNKNFMTE